ncbi:MAG: hypothetical protein ACE5OZ_09450 [Candidatus Heimdallarchaeota archaeon]
MSSTRSLWLAVFIIGAFLLSMPSLGVNSTAVESSPEITETSTERFASDHQPPIPSRTPPAPLGPTNVTFGTPYAHGVWDMDGNGLNDYFYINVTITVVTTIDNSKFSSWVVLAFLNYSNPDPAESDHFPQLFGFEEEAMFSEGGPGGPMSTFGETLGPVDVAIFFRGDYLNASIIGNEQLVVTGLALLGVPIQQGMGPELLGYTGQFIGGGSPWSPWPSSLYTTSTYYWAYDFEPWIGVTIDDWNHRFVDIGPNAYFEYLVFEVNVTGTIYSTAISNFRARVEIELETGAWSSNTTIVVNGPKQIIDVYFRSQDLWQDPGNSDFPNNGKFNVSQVEISRWKDDHWQNAFRNESEPGKLIYGTGPSAISEWERNPQTALIHQSTAKWNLTLIDTQPDGLYELAELTVQVNVSAYGFYILTGRFGMQNGYGLDAEVAAWLERGDLRNMTLTFRLHSLRSLPDIGAPVIGDFRDYNNTDLELRNGRDEQQDSWSTVFVHAYNFGSNNFEPITFMNLPYTMTIPDFQVGTPRAFTYMLEQSQDIGDVLNITLSYPWYEDFRDRDGTPYEFEIHLIDGDWAAIGPTWDARYEQWWVDKPRDQLYPLNRGSPYAGRWIFIKVYSRANDPLIPQNISVTLNLRSITDNSLPTGSVTEPVTTATLSDEFGFKIAGHVEDLESTVLSVRFRLGTNQQDSFAATTPAFHYDRPNHPASWDNRNVTEFSVDDNGNFEFYAYPRGDSWSGAQTITMRIVNYALNWTEISIPVTFTNDPDPFPQHMLLNGLTWLASQQQTDGSYMGSTLWSPHGEPGQNDPSARTVALTAWAMLAFLQNGSSYAAPPVQTCWNYIASQIQPDGSIQSPQIGTPTYETAIALMGLIPLKSSYEAQGSSNATLNSAILGAVDFLISLQNNESRGYSPGDPFYGGWGFGSPYHHGADLSNTQWAIIALAAARDDGITAAQDANIWTSAEGFVRRCLVESGYWDGPTWMSEGYGFGYQPPGAGWSEPLDAMNAAGIWTLALMGYDDSDSNISQALQWMNDSWSSYIRYDIGSIGNRYYALYSAAKALLLTGHSSSSQYSWMFQSIDDFLNSQVIRDPIYMDRWFWDNSAGSEDPVYTTLMAVLSLQLSVIYDITPPLISSPLPADLTFEEGASSPWINWHVSDANPGTYTITKDGAFVEDGTWTNATPISYDVSASGLSPGTYIFRLTVWDLAGNSQFDEVTVTVTYDPSGYSISLLQPNGGETISGSYTIQWSASNIGANPMTFNLEYSQDAGSFWAQFASGVTGQQYSWDTTTVSDGSNYLIRVTITETTVSDTSDSTFTINNEGGPTSSEEDTSEGDPTRSSPGFELLIVIMSLVAVTILVRRSRRY